MKVSLAWVQEFANIDRSVEELVELIGSRLVEVEEIVNWRDRFKGVIIGEIKEVKAHENADKLNVYQVNIGNEVIQVVSGDKNLHVGDKVGYIAPGVTVPVTFDSKAPVVIQDVNMRGEPSHGMLGSGRELCLNEDHRGVAVLDTDEVAGTPFMNAYNLDDIILDIENKSFTHRPDCFGLLGLAREIAAIQEHDFESPNWFTTDTIEMKGGKGLPLKVTNDVPTLVPRYMMAAVQGIKIEPSSLMMQSLLTRMGVRPINNIVDITNYLMLLTGQPLHAFDYDKVRKVSGTKEGELIEITVREAKKGEKLQLLDGREIEVREGAIVIATPKGPIALGGIMGGAETEVDEHTKNIIIESANFDMYNIRVSSMTHGLFTEAVTRFAKGQSPAICAPVLGHALGMALESGDDAKLGSELVDVYPTPKEAPTIHASSKWINRFLGTSLTTGDMAAMLHRVEFHISVEGDELTVTPPLWRSDIHRAEDVADEVGRLHGFDNIQPTMAVRDFQPVLATPLEQLKTELRGFLADVGANEALTYSFVSQSLMEQTNQKAETAFHLANSLSPELAYVRTNLLGSLLGKVHPNLKAGFDEFVLYEINKTESKDELEEDKLPLERQAVAVVFAASDKAYDQKARGAAYYQAKHYLEKTLHRVGVDGVRYRLLRPHTEESIPAWLRLRVGMFDHGRSAIVLKGRTMLGVVGEPTPAVRRALKLPKATAMFELNLEEVLQTRATKPAYTPLSRFPATEQDICFKLPADLPYNDLMLAVSDFLHGKKEVQTSVEPVDIFQRDDDTAHKQITIRLRLQRRDRTLTTAEVNELLDHLAAHIHSALRAERI